MYWSIGQRAEGNVKGITINLHAQTPCFIYEEFQNLGGAENKSKTEAKSKDDGKDPEDKPSYYYSVSFQVND